MEFILKSRANMLFLIEWYVHMQKKKQIRIIFPILLHIKINYLLSLIHLLIVVFWFLLLGLQTEGMGGVRLGLGNTVVKFRKVMEDPQGRRKIIIALGISIMLFLLYLWMW